jgi:DNA-binding Lrp family transcriptional regulator
VNELDKQLLNEFQRDFPLSPTPYAVIAETLGVTEDDVIESLRALVDNGTVSRVGPVFRPNQIGSSTLAAMAVPAARLQEVAELVNAFAEVNHNYEREHRFNLWFVVTAASRERLQAILTEIEQRTNIPALSLPMLKEYHINLGFRLRWD